MFDSLKRLFEKKYTQAEFDAGSFKGWEDGYDAAMSKVVGTKPNQPAQKPEHVVKIVTGPKLKDIRLNAASESDKPLMVQKPTRKQTAKSSPLNLTPDETAKPLTLAFPGDPNKWMADKIVAEAIKPTRKRKAKQPAPAAAPVATQEPTPTILVPAYTRANGKQVRAYTKVKGRGGRPTTKKVKK
jgi:hypothetical protein